MGQEGYGVEALRATSGDGISGFSSRSDQARARELSKYGLTMTWFDQKVEEQQNLCADCSKTEKSKLGNGKRRPLGLGFNSDGTPDRLICTTCASKQRKTRMEEHNAPKDYASFEEFWAVNREQLQKEDPITFATLRERDADVREIYEIICIYLRRHDGKPCYQLTDTLDEVEKELIENSTTDLDQLSCPFHRVEHRHLFDEIQAAAELPNAPRHARNCAVFAKYGLLQALPVSVGDTYVREFLRKNGRWPFPDWGKAPDPNRTQKCATYGCKSELTYKTSDPIPPPQWYCSRCEEIRRSKSAPVPPRNEDRLFMSGGVMKDTSPTLPVWLRES